MSVAPFQIPQQQPRPCVYCQKPTTNYNAWGHSCDDCTATKNEAAREQRAIELADRRHRQVVKTMAGLSTRFPRMETWTLENYPDDAAGKAARAQAEAWIGAPDDKPEAYIYDGASTLYIHGPVGTGKTSLAWSTMRKLIERDCWQADFHNVRQLLAEARKSFGKADVADPLEGLEDVPLLVLDDLGAERPTPWALEAIATLVEARYLKERDTIVTSNYTPAQLVKRLGIDGDLVLGQRIVSRLVESSRQIKLTGPDRRVQRQAA